MTKITISLIKADVGGYPGHSSVHPMKTHAAKSKKEQKKIKPSKSKKKQVTAMEKDDLRKIKVALALITIAQMIGIAWAMQDLRSIPSLQIAILTTALRVLV
jgi:fructose 1,6-bisphosphatase